METEVKVKLKNKMQPKLQFKEFRDAWKDEKIGKLLIEYRLGGNYANSDLQTKYPLIKMGNIGRGSIVLDKVQYINENVKIDQKDQIQFGDLFFNTRNTLELVGKVAVWRNELPLAYYNSNLMWLKFSNNFFMNYRLNSPQVIKLLRRLATGTTSVAAIYTKDFLKIKVSIPSLPEQQKIASFLSAVDQKIQQLTRKKELLEKYKKGVMQKLFSGKLRFKDEKGKEFPEWKRTRLGELTYKVDKKNKLKINYPVYSINNRVGFVPQSEQFEDVNSNDRGYDISLYKVIQKDTFAYNPARINVGSIGFSDQLENIIVSSLYVCFKTTDKLEDRYLLKYLNTYHFNNDVLRYAEGGVRSYLFYENFSLIKIPLPSIKEQIIIANFIECIDQRIKNIEDTVIKAQSFKKALLQQLFV